MKHAVVHNCTRAAIAYSSEAEPPVELLGCISALLSLLSEEKTCLLAGRARGRYHSALLHPLLVFLLSGDHTNTGAVNWRHGLRVTDNELWNYSCSGLYGDLYPSFWYVRGRNCIPPGFHSLPSVPMSARAG